MPSLPSINDLLKKKPAAPAIGKKPVEDINSVESKFEHKMKEIDLKEKEALTAGQAAGSGADYIDLSKFPISAEALRVLPEETAKAKKAICFLFTGEELRLGVLAKNAEIEELAYQLGERNHSHVAIYLISENSLAKALKLYANLPIVKP
ncbi:MAG: hypothetical protein Q8L21_00575, partial [Candidatus Komeilibacteria bacterium]|nr:hypothetical protein [Candidatus Komeilibacteria bacterium]